MQSSREATALLASVVPPDLAAAARGPRADDGPIRLVRARWVNLLRSRGFSAEASAAAVELLLS